MDLVISWMIFAVTVSRVFAAKEPFDANPKYDYGYSVDDDISGDTKKLQERRDGDVVEGSYSLLEPDGTRRIVKYTVDSVNGFNAVVRRYPPKNTMTTSRPIVVTDVSKRVNPSANRAQVNVPKPKIQTPPRETSNVIPNTARSLQMTTVVSTTSTTTARPRNNRVTTTTRAPPVTRTPQFRNLYNTRVGKAFSAPIFASPFTFPTFFGFRSPTGHILPGSAIVTTL